MFPLTDRPKCVTSVTTYFIYDKPVTVNCTVTSHPPTNSIYWQWEDRDEMTSAAPLRRGGGVATSLLTVEPSSSHRRNLYCWATNEIGDQIIPCNFTIRGKENLYVTKPLRIGIYVSYCQTSCLLAHYWLFLCHRAEVGVPGWSCRVVHISTSSLTLVCLAPPHLEVETTTLYTAEVSINVEPARPIRLSTSQPQPQPQNKAFMLELSSSGFRHLFLSLSCAVYY